MVFITEGFFEVAIESYIYIYIYTYRHVYIYTYRQPDQKQANTRSVLKQKHPLGKTCSGQKNLFYLTSLLTEAVLGASNSIFPIK